MNNHANQPAEEQGTDRQELDELLRFFSARQYARSLNKVRKGTLNLKTEDLQRLGILKEYFERISVGSEADCPLVS